MVALTGAQFRMHTNMKASANSQGTLFQGGNPTPATGKPWPRGYSPQRRDEVTGPTSGWPSGRGAISEEARRGVETIARSTVPASHLDGLYANYHDSAVTAVGDGRSGDYQKQGRALGLMRIAPGRAASTTTIHEIGHHVSARIDQSEHSAYNTPTTRGAEEGFAENYAETHFRDRRVKPVQIDRGPEGWAGKEESPAASNDFRRTFRTMRAAGAPEHSNWRDRRSTPAQGQQTELLARFASGNGEHHWSYANDAPDHLERQVPGHEEAQRRKERGGERFLAQRGLQRSASTSPRFNHFPSGVVQ